MANSLVIVESPAKAKTIEKFLGKGYHVLASYGHVRDLPSKDGSVDVENDFLPKYIVSAKAKKQLALLKKALKDADELVLATDPDREGEAISWHLLEVLKPKIPVRRITFHEITKGAIEAALADRPYTVFYGHEHSYLHETRHGRDYIRLGTTGGVQNPRKDMAIDHVSLVTVSETGVDIANLRLSGIFGKDGRIPLDGDDLCFDVRACGGQ